LREREEEEEGGCMRKNLELSAAIEKALALIFWIVF